MSEYCSHCNSSPFEEADIDLTQIALSIENGRSVSFICEGCNNRSIYKDEIGLLYLGKQVNGEIELKLIKLEDLLTD